MTLTSTPSTRLAVAGGIDPTPPESSVDQPAAGFELLLADAQGSDDSSNPSDPSDSSNSTGTEHDGSTTDTTTGATSKDSSTAPAPKPAPDADSTGLLGTLGALAMTPPPVTIPDTPPAPATDASDSPPVTDVTDVAAAPTVLDLVAAAISASDVSVGGPTPADPPTPPTVPTNLSALLEPAPRDAGPPASALEPAPSSPAPNIPAANTMTAMTANGSPPAPAGASSHPPIVDSAGPPPSDRPRPQAQVASAPSGAATFTAPTPAAAPTVAGTDEWTAATATVAAPPPAEQLVSVLTPLRTTPTGSYTLRLELKPPEMGRVEMRVEMRDGVLHASIHAEREGAAQLVRDSLGELRDRLNAEGVKTGDLTVSDGGVGPGSHDGEDAPGSGPSSPGPTVASSDDPANGTGIPNPMSPDSTSLLDVRV